VDKIFGGHMVWVGMLRGRFVGGRNVKAPKIGFASFLKLNSFSIYFLSLAGFSKL
jgi:hypothetical protein